MFLDPSFESRVQVYFLNFDQQPGMHKKLHDVPALVINYDKDFDLQDREQKERYVTQVNDYFKWVEELRYCAHSCIAGTLRVAVECF